MKDSVKNKAPVAKIQPSDCTDLANRQRLLLETNGDYLYCHTWKTWMLWTGKVWETDVTAKIFELSTKVELAILGEAALTVDKSAREALVDWAAKTQNVKRCEAMIKALRSHPEVAVVSDMFDQRPSALNVGNGTLDLATGKLLEHSKDDYLTKIIDIDYDPDATCPRWLTFLDEVFQGDSDLIEFVKKAIGYSLTGAVREQKLFFLYGSGANGKSTLIEIVKEVMGPYAKALAPDALIVKKHPGISADIAGLRGIRFAPTVEVGEGRRMAEALIKQLTGGDTISARFLYSNPFEFKPEAKIWLCANHKPIITGTDLGIWRRIDLIPFMKSFQGKDADKELFSKLLAELPGILNWAIEGCLSWRKDGLNEPEKVLLATQRYQEESDTMGVFISECLEYPTDPPECTMTGREIAALYAEWAKANHEQEMTSRQINSELDSRKWAFKKDRKGSKVWLNVGLKYGYKYLTGSTS